MTTPQLRPTATVTVNDGSDDITVDVDSGDVTLDALRIPYATARVTIPLVSHDTIEAIDPRNAIRAHLVGGDESGSSRTFNLGIRSREVDHRARQIIMDLASDEALLFDYAGLTEDTGARAHETSLRAVCNYVLEKIGATLGAGDVDADVTAYWALTNEVLNPRGRTNADHWRHGTGASGLTAITMSTPLPSIGDRAIRWTTAAGDSNAIASPTNTTIPVTPGRSYVFAFEVATSGTPRFAQAVIQWWGADGDVKLGVTGGDEVASDSTAFRTVYVVAEAPAGAQYAYPYAHTRSNAAGQNHFASCARFYEGSLLVPPFDGSMPDDTGYSYRYEGDPDASPSTRTPFVARDPDLFVWPAGVNAWEFLEALTSVAGLRLYCDEERNWHLINPEDHYVGGLLSVAGWNATEGRDIISLDDEDVVCTGVVVRYRWRDAAGREREETDSAGTPGKVLVWEYDRPYPGPGAAAAILARRAGQGRVQEVIALANWNATPAMEVSVSLPGTVDQIGRLQTVTWRLGDGLMDVGSTQLADAAPDTWLGTNPELDWEDLDPDLDWEDA